MGLARTLVTGGAHGLGAEVVRALQTRGEYPRILSRRLFTGASDDIEWVVGDLRNGAGLTEALAGVSTVIHCASSAREPAFATEIQGAQNLSERAREAGVAHLIYISIVGVDRSEYPYYVAKREAERIFSTGATPWSILRATQFHDLVYALLRDQDTGAIPLRVKPNMRFQSVAREEVAMRLIELADAAPAGYAPPMSGPELLTIEEMARAYLATLGRVNAVDTLPMNGKPLSPFQTGVNLVPHATFATRGRQTWVEYLRNRI
jgi:uncharacterized protein YbjT (DUF2867 family)